MAKKANKKKVQADISELFSAALAIYESDAEYAHKYVQYARKLAQSNTVRFTTSQRRLFCHNCYHYLYPGKNCIVRIDSENKMLLHICKDCEHVNRFGYKE